MRDTITKSCRDRYEFVSIVQIYIWCDNIYEYTSIKIYVSIGEKGIAGGVGGREKGLAGWVVVGGEGW